MLMINALQFGTYTFINIQDLCSFCVSTGIKKIKTNSGVWIPPTALWMQLKTGESTAVKERDIYIENISFTVLATSESKAVDRLASIYI